MHCTICSLDEREAGGLQEAEADFKYAHAPAYLKYLRDRLTVNFVRLDQAAKADVQPLRVELLRTSTYEETCRALAAALQVCAGALLLPYFPWSSWCLGLGFVPSSSGSKGRTDRLGALKIGGTNSQECKEYKGRVSFLKHGCELQQEWCFADFHRYPVAYQEASEPLLFDASRC